MDNKNENSEEQKRPKDIIDVKLNQKWFDEVQQLVFHIFGTNCKLTYKHENQEILVDYNDSCGIIEDLIRKEIWTYVTKYYHGSSTELSENEIIEQEKIENINDVYKILVNMIAKRKMDTFF